MTTNEVLSAAVLFLGKLLTGQHAAAAAGALSLACFLMAWQLVHRGGAARRARGF